MTAILTLRTGWAAEASSSLLPLLLALALLLGGAKLAGALAVRLGQPAVLGELLAGLAFGPSLLDLLHQPFLFDPTGMTAATLQRLGELGVIFLMFGAGLETDLAGMRASGRPALWAGVLGVLTPIAFSALALAPLMGEWNTPLLLGIVLGATSVSISVQTLVELRKLRTPEGLALLGAAVIDDILVILALALFAALWQGTGGLGLALLRMVLTLAASVMLGYFVLPWIADRARRLPISKSLLSMVVVVALFFAWSAEYVGGVAAITGAFIAGVGVGRSHWRDEVARDLEGLNYAFFVPLFLVSVGLSANVRTVAPAHWGLAGLLVVIAVVSKVAGSGLGARLGGFTPRQSLRVGLGMISRGEVGLIVAGAGQSMGLLDTDTFTLIALVVLTTTIITPPLLRWSMTERTDHGQADPAGAG
ncbi:MAG TPA: cation:proton antiporter [Anaerolineales bacterium]|nr:cation:proton antiporter [Anaerolineales bacterium]